jgi:hypothetical protein
MYVRDGFLLFDLPVESQVIWELARCCKNATTQIQFIVVIFGWTQFGVQVRMATCFSKNGQWDCYTERSKSFQVRFNDHR